MPEQRAASSGSLDFHLRQDYSDKVCRCTDLMEISSPLPHSSGRLKAKGSSGRAAWKPRASKTPLSTATSLVQPLCPWGTAANFSPSRCLDVALGNLFLVLEQGQAAISRQGKFPSHSLFSTRHTWKWWAQRCWERDCIPNQILHHHSASN